METNIFEYATRRKLRFVMSKGVIITEDLWDLSLESLNTLAKSLNKRVKESEEEDFIGKTKIKSNQEKDLEIQFELVKYVIKVKLEERDKRKVAAEKAEKLRRLRDKLEAAQDKELDQKSAEDLQKMIEELEKED